MTEKLMRDALILWTTIDPIGTLALFTAITSTLTPEQRRKTALKASLFSLAILMGAIVVGQIVLSTMGIQLISLQVSGGIILFLFGLKMIFGSGFADNSRQGEPGHDIAVFPLAVPSIATPGAIMAVILLTDNNVYSIPMQLGTALILLLILGVTYLFMLAANPIMKVIGKNGSAILVRIMGMILASLSIELVMKALNFSQWIEKAP